MRYLIDAYAWVEYLEGSTLGMKLRKIIQENELLSLSLTVAEVVSKVKRKCGNADIAYQALTANSRIISFSPENAREAGLLHAEVRKKVKNFGLVDSLLLVIARDLKVKIITGDHHFKEFKETIFLSDI